MYTFKKNERLGNFRLRSLLFSKGRHFFQHPFRIVYLCVPGEDIPAIFRHRKVFSKSGVFHYQAKCLIGVSGRQVKKAVSRNRIKRLVKEAYRKNKSQFYSFLEEKEARCLLAIMYSANKEMEYDDIERSLIRSLQKLRQEIGSHGLDDLQTLTQN